MLNALGKAIGAGLGTGLSPIAPGTVGSLAAVAIYYFIALAVGSLSLYFLVALVIGGSAIGVWATGLLVTEDESDPGRAVWDEFVGMWITCLFLPPTILWLALAFVLFRVFDVLKPWPANVMERLPRGWGIMADDVVAGLYGAVLLNVAHLAWRYSQAAWGS